MNFAEFLAYFPGDGSVVDDVEFAVLKEQKDFLFYGEVSSLADMPVPVHRYPVRIINLMLSNSINDYLHKITNYLVCYCEERKIGTLIIGDITNIRRERNLGRRTNQKLHGLPYRQIYRKLEYKLKKKGIRMVLQEESYSSQCSPKAKEVSRKYAEKKNRIKRGLYKDQGILYHADAVGAYNIMRKYLALSGKEKELPISGLKEIKRIKVAV